MKHFIVHVENRLPMDCLCNIIVSVQYEAWQTSMKMRSSSQLSRLMNAEWQGVDPGDREAGRLME